jgi:GxxExxY protein
MKGNVEVYNPLTGKIIEACIHVHKELGPGLLESVYEEVLNYVLKKRGFVVGRQVPIPVMFEDVHMEMGFRADLVVDKTVILELKSIETVAPVHKKQLITYLKLSKLPLGLLINFNEVLLKDGISRILNTYR